MAKESPFDVNTSRCMISHTQSRPPYGLFSYIMLPLGVWSVFHSLTYFSRSVFILLGFFLAAMTADSRCRRWQLDLPPGRPVDIWEDADESPPPYTQNDVSFIATTRD